jgi:hypothetical protein
MNPAAFDSIEADSVFVDDDAKHQNGTFETMEVPWYAQREQQRLFIRGRWGKRLLLEMWLWLCGRLC